MLPKIIDTPFKASNKLCLIAEDVIIYHHVYTQLKHDWLSWVTCTNPRNPISYHGVTFEAFRDLIGYI